MEQVAIGKNQFDIGGVPLSKRERKMALCGGNQSIDKVGQQSNNACYQHVNAIIRGTQRTHDNACGLERQNNVDNRPDVLSYGVDNKAGARIHISAIVGCLVADNTRKESTDKKPKGWDMLP